MSSKGSPRITDTLDKLDGTLYLDFCDNGFKFEVCGDRKGKRKDEYGSVRVRLVGHTLPELEALITEAWSMK